MNIPNNSMEQPNTVSQEPSIAQLQFRLASGDNTINSFVMNVRIPHTIFFADKKKINRRL